MNLDIPRLCYAIQRSRLSMRFFREDRREAVRLFAGDHWSEHSSREERLLNLISLYVNVVGRNLVAKDPRIALETWDRGQKPIVSIGEKWCNQQIQRIHLATTLQRAVLDGLFSIGCVKVGLASPSDAALRSWNLVGGEPFAVPIDLDDLVWDVHARDFSECSFIGHRYRVPLDTVKDSKLYSAARRELTPSEDPLYNAQGDERVHVLGRGIYTASSEEYEDMVDLWEIYLPRHRVVVTLADMDVHDAIPSGGRGESLREQRWIGPDNGPYHILAFQLVPGNLPPKGPIMDLINLDRDTNEIYRKLVRQAKRQKEILAITGSRMEDGQRIQQASDGDIISVTAPEQSVVRMFGSPNPNNAQFGVHLADKFDFMAGNLALLGGLAPQSKTLGQDRMLAENSSGQIQDMQQTALKFTEHVCRSLLWFWWHDPFKTMKVTHSLPGLPEISTVRQATSQQRMDVRFEELELRVNPYSVRPRSPQEEMQVIDQIVQQFMPVMQLLQQQGIALDMNAYLEVKAKALDIPALQDIFTIQNPQAPSSGGQRSGGKPQNTQREYIRRSVGSDTAANRGAGYSNFMNAGQNQNKQGAA